MEELLKSYYRQTDRTTDMIYLATNFHVIVDPSITYSTDKTLNHQIWNNTYSDDEDLYYRAVNMRRTDPLDVYDYVAKWVSFQERYNEVLPTIPVYSNIYFDFLTPKLQNYWIAGGRRDAGRRNGRGNRGVRLISIRPCRGRGVFPGDHFLMEESVP